MKIYRILAVIFLFFSFLNSGFAQEFTEINGKVIDNNGNGMAGVNIVLKGTLLGTTTNIHGDFKTKFNTSPPIILVVSMIGYETIEIEIDNNRLQDLKIILNEQAIILGQDVVVSASRVEESILESPVSIEKIGILDIQNSASDSYYKTIANLKGVDMTTSSINFQSFNARGFNSTGNARFVQLIDGMDTQAPALNFSIGSLTGPSDLDVESIEFIPGAASALYGPNAFNGILLINSKNPFEYQGLSAYYKQGFNHFGNSNLNNFDPLINPNSTKFGPDQIKPMFEGSIRYANSHNDKLAYKINFTFAKATDWYGTSLNDRNLLAQQKPAGLNHNPGIDRLHAYGDEVALNLALLANNQDFIDEIENQNLGVDISQLPNVVVSRTPYLESSLVDYDAKNLRGNLGVFYRLNNNLELSYNYNAGFGTTVHTGAQRYSLSNFNIQQHKIELRSTDFFVRAYTTFENSGKSYIADLTGILINDTWESNEYWYGLYGASYLTATQLFNLPPEDAHLFSRRQADNNVYNPQEAPFLSAMDSVKSKVVPFGSKFADKSRMYQTDAQYNFASQFDFVDILVGASIRIFDLRSNGTIFADTPDNPINILEYGGFIQAGKSVLNEKIRLLASLRYDKNENFKGQISPRLSTVIKPAKDHNIRLSFQTGFRNPTTQGQHIDLNVVSARLIGGLDYYKEKYNIIENAYTALSVESFITRVAENTDPTEIGNPEVLGLLEKVEEIEQVKPEQVTSFEAGYKSLINKTLLIDLAVYYNIYNDFITQTQVRKAGGVIIIPEGTSDDPASPDYWGNHPLTPQNIQNAQLLLTPISTPGEENTFATYTNFDRQVTAGGLAFGVGYYIGNGFLFNGNYSWNRLIEGLSSDYLNDFNTPEHKFNLGISNRKIFDHFGFNMLYRWQNAFRWEGGFGRGDIPAIGTLDAQVTYKLVQAKSSIKLGGSNLLNKRYVLNYGGPTLGAIYYITVSFDQLLN